MFISLWESRWLDWHAKKDEDGDWVCKGTGNVLEKFQSAHLIQWPGFMGATVTIGIFEQHRCPVFAQGHSPLVHCLAIPEHQVQEL